MRHRSISRMADFRCLCHLRVDVLRRLLGSEPTFVSSIARTSHVWGPVPMRVEAIYLDEGPRLGSHRQVAQRETAGLIVMERDE
jgi:hypothetical protein